jgi:uncharacterized membrane protein YgdD (TMEM256/DUF423 family)
VAGGQSPAAEARFVRQRPGAPNFWTGTEMRTHTTTALYVMLMAVVIVVIDVLFFRHRFWERLTVNVGIVLVFGAFYFRFLKRP